MSKAIKIVGVSVLRKYMSKVNRKLSDRRKANMRAIVVIDRMIQKNFASEGKTFAGGWQSLAPATVARRRKGSRTILQDKGDLKKRWKHTATNRIGKIESGVPYGKPHDEGLGHLPKRQILPKVKDYAPEVLKVYDNFVERALD